MPAASEKTAETSGEAPATPVTLTVRARREGEEIRVEEKIQDGYALRLKVLGGGCSGFAYDLYFDQPQDIDHAFESNGVKMRCDQMSLMYLMGTRLTSSRACRARASSSATRT